MNDIYYIKVKRYAKVVNTDGHITGIYNEDESDDEDSEAFSYIQGVLQVPEQIPESIALQLLKEKKAVRISNYVAELNIISQKIKNLDLTYEQKVAKFEEERKKLEQNEELMKETRKFNEESYKRLHSSPPKTKEEISKILKDLEKYE